MNKRISCPLCNSDDCRFIVNRREIEPRILKNYFNKIGINYAEGVRAFGRDIYSCPSCSITFIFPNYDSSTLDLLYGEYSLPTEKNSSEESLDSFLKSNEGAIIARQDMIINFGLHEKPGLRVLDVGSYKGINHAAFKRFDFDVFGVEISESAAMFCANHVSSPDKVIVGEFVGTTFDDKFDLMTMHHVIEHVIDLDKFLEKAYHDLTENGSLIVETPLYEYANTRNYNGRFIDIYHTLFFTSNSLIYALNKNGFRLNSFYPINFTINGIDSHIYGCYLFEKEETIEDKNDYVKLSSILEKEMISRTNELIDKGTLIENSFYEFYKSKFNSILGKVFNR